MTCACLCLRLIYDCANAKASRSPQLLTSFPVSFYMFIVMGKCSRFERILGADGICPMLNVRYHTGLGGGWEFVVIRLVVAPDFSHLMLFCTTPSFKVVIAGSLPVA